MDSGVFILLSGALTFGVPLAFALRELVLLRRDPGGGGGSWKRGRAPLPSPPPTPAGYRPLPDCLIPKPPPSAARPRILENA